MQWRLLSIAGKSKLKLYPSENICTCHCFGATPQIVTLLEAPVFSFWPDNNPHIFDIKKCIDSFSCLNCTGGWTAYRGTKRARGLEASGQHHWPLGGESPSSCSGGTPLVAAEPSDPVIKETKVAGGSERAHNVNTGGGVVFWSPTSTPKMGSVRSLSERLESLPFVCIVWWLNVIRCHDQQVWMNFTPDDSWCRWHLFFSEMAWASQEQFKIAT